MATGTPQQLEQTISSRKTEIIIEQPNEAIVKALRKLSLQNLTVDGNRITFDVTNPDKENSPVVEAIVLAGGHIRNVNVVGSSLEETYLKLVRKEHETI
jgi:hypothetical protein